MPVQCHFAGEQLFADRAFVVALSELETKVHPKFFWFLNRHLPHLCVFAGAEDTMYGIVFYTDTDGI